MSAVNRSEMNRWKRNLSHGPIRWHIRVGQLHFSAQVITDSAPTPTLRGLRRTVFELLSSCLETKHIKTSTCKRKSISYGRLANLCHKSMPVKFSYQTVCEFIYRSTHIFFQLLFSWPVFHSYVRCLTDLLRNTLGNCWSKNPYRPYDLPGAEWSEWRRFLVDVDHSWWQQPWLVQSSCCHFARTMTNSSLPYANTKPPLLWFQFQLPLEACFKSLRLLQCCMMIRSTATTSHAMVWLVMHVVLRFLLRIFM